MAEQVPFPLLTMFVLLIPDTVGQGFSCEKEVIAKETITIRSKIFFMLQVLIVKKFTKLQMLLSQLYMMNHFIHNHVVIHGEWTFRHSEGWNSTVSGIGGSLEASGEIG